MPDRENLDSGQRPRLDPEARTLSEWRITQIEKRLDQELRELRSHIDKSIAESRKYIDDEIKDIRDSTEVRFGKIEKMIYGAFAFVGTPVFGAVVGLFFKTNPLAGG